VGLWQLSLVLVVCVVLSLLPSFVPLDRRSSPSVPILVLVLRVVVVLMLVVVVVVV
jgi:hypothetical protein